MEGEKLATKTSTTNDEMDINEWGNSFNRVVEAATVVASGTAFSSLVPTKIVSTTASAVSKSKKEGLS
eukprot:11554527-Ditylum_brightwellii.AAC.1